MHIHVDKTQQSKDHLLANGATQMMSNGKATYQFVDNRPEVVEQRKFQDLANAGPQAKHAAQLQSIVAIHAANQQHSIQKKENNTGLSDNLKSGIENLSGYSMDDVRVHHNSDKPAQVQALAYAQGTDIHLASRQEKHLPHEAWHVVQQKQGRVKPTLQMKGMAVNNDIKLEREADLMGAKALNLKTKDKLNTTLNTPSIGNLGHPAQMFWPEAIALLLGLGVAVKAGVTYFGGETDVEKADEGAKNDTEAEEAEQKREIEAFLKQMGHKKNKLTKKGKSTINYVGDLLASKKLQTAVDYINKDRKEGMFFKPPSPTPPSSKEVEYTSDSDSSETRTFETFSSKQKVSPLKPKLVKPQVSKFIYCVDAIPNCKLRTCPTTTPKSTCTVDTSNTYSTGAEPLVVIHGDALIDGKYVTGEIHGHLDISQSAGNGQLKQFTHFSRIHFKLPNGKYYFVSINVPLGILTVDNGLNFRWKSTKFWAPKMVKANLEFKARDNKRKESDYSN